MNDPINPEHYKQHSIEAIEVVEEFFRHDSHLATAYVYLHRAGDKGGSSIVEDVKKAIWWLERARTHPCHVAASISAGRIAYIDREVFTLRFTLGTAFRQMALAHDVNYNYAERCSRAIEVLEKGLEPYTDDNDTTT